MHESAVHVVRFADVEIRQPGQEFPEQMPQFHLRELPAQAEVRAGTAEPHMRIGGAGEVECVRVVENGGIAIGGTVEQHQLLTCRDRCPGNLGSDGRVAREMHHRCRPAHEFLDRAVDALVEIRQ